MWPLSTALSHTLDKASSTPAAQDSKRPCDSPVLLRPLLKRVYAQMHVHDAALVVRECRGEVPIKASAAVTSSVPNSTACWLSCITRPGDIISVSRIDNEKSLHRFSCCTLHHDLLPTP